MAQRKAKLFVLTLLAALLVPESVCDAALAAGIGRKRYTARLSSNRALRKQQLIVDPEGILGGSASVQYDPLSVRLVDVLAPADFEITGGFVGLLPEIGGLTDNLVPLDVFFGGGGIGSPPTAAKGNENRETGYVQIFFDRRDTPDQRGADKPAANNSVIPNLPGYMTVAEDGQTGINDTHALVFEYLPGIREETEAVYRIFATGPRTQTIPDFIITEADPANPIPFTEIGSAKVLGSLVTPEVRPGGPTPVPLPPAAALAGLGLGLLMARHALKRLRYA